MAVIVGTVEGVTGRLPEIHEGWGRQPMMAADVTPTAPGHEPSPEPANVRTAWARWLDARMTRLGWTTSSELARASGIPDSVISRWRSGISQPAIEQLRRLRDPLQSSMLELLVAAGHLTVEEAALTDRPVPAAPDLQFRSLRDAVRRDAELSEDLKDLLLVQYDAMVALARAREIRAS